MNETIDGIDAFGRIRAFIRKKYGTQRKCARALGISESHLSDMLNSRCELSPVLMSAAGLVRRVVYEVRELPERAEDDCQKEDTASRKPQRAPSLPLTGYRIGLTAEAVALGLNRLGLNGWVIPRKTPQSAVFCPAQGGPDRIGTARP